jgi:2',3'-cyclic-nucleotide 2'-phosphodiesterase (5'-nucleotidase family)
VEGHIKESSYSADWGDVYSFIQHMKRKAHQEGRDLLLVDSGDLHDGTGLSDTTTLDGEITDEIFKNVDFDVLAVGYVPSLSLLTKESRTVCWRDNESGLREICSAI